jgi:hypothetical protein
VRNDSHLHIAHSCSDARPAGCSLGVLVAQVGAPVVADVLLAGGQLAAVA